MADIVDINKFFSIASSKQFSRDFFMRVSSIKVVGKELLGDNELVFARTATLPGRDIEDKLVNYSGQTFHLNGKSSYPGSESYPIEFYMDQGLDLRAKLETISRLTFDNDTTSGQLCMPGDDSWITLDVLSVPCGTGNAGGAGLQISRQIKLIGANIRTIGAVEYQIADGTGEVKTLPTTWSYHWYEDFTSGGIL